MMRALLAAAAYALSLALAASQREAVCEFRNNAEAGERFQIACEPAEFSARCRRTGSR